MLTAKIKHKKTFQIERFFILLFSNDVTLLRLLSSERFEAQNQPHGQVCCNHMPTGEPQVNEMHGTDTVVNKVAENIVVLEKVAAELFRLISNQVNGTPLDIIVDPYIMNLKTPYDRLAHANGFASDAAIKKDVFKMWFYKNAVAA